jgi:FolB domain-containing protein
MTLMLASVRDLDEAETALAGGADIVDLKEPGRGALGAVDVETIAAVAIRMRGRAATSAVCGDLPMVPHVLAARTGEIAGTGVDYVKVGFFPSADALACVDALRDVSRRVKLVAVVFADLGHDAALVPALAANGFHAVMADTADKSGGRLLDHMPPGAAAAFVASGQAAGLKVGLAGSLEAPDVPRLLACAPDFLGFRSALCGAQGRGGTLDAEAVLRIRSLIPEEGTPRTAGVDYRLLAARGYSPIDVDPSLGTDRIFVRDFVLPVEIGAYSFERGHTQQVRFGVETDVLRVTEDPQDMRHVFSYDIIMDGIRGIVAEGHVELSETLAERIAAKVLLNPRAVRVKVSVEKLELGAGGVGVEIERRRRTGAAGAVPARDGGPRLLEADGKGGKA